MSALEGGPIPLTESQIQLNNFWSNAMEEVKTQKNHDFKVQELPLARIKKIMKLDEDVKMISAEAPALFAKAAEFFINELTLRAWVHAEENKRRTLQRNDIAMAISKFDQFDFLIDIVPREEIRPPKKHEEPTRTAVSTEQVQYVLQMPTQAQQGQVIQQPVHIITGSTATAISTQTQPVAQEALHISQPMERQQQAAKVVQQTAAVSSPVSSTPTMQVYTQIVSPNGEIQHVPIQLTAAQMQAIQAQMQGKAPNQPIVIQTAVDSDTVENNEDGAWNVTE